MSAEADALASDWMESLDPNEKIGTRHHTVPRFYLELWASKESRLFVRNRSTDLAPGSGAPRNITDMGIRDFYTTKNKDGSFDGRLESVLNIVESSAAEVIRTMLNPLLAARPLTLEEQYGFSQFLAFQFVRGPRTRREIELNADWMMKTMANGHIPAAELRDMTFVPHSNEHLRMFGTLAEAIQPYIYDRPNVLVILDEPLLYSCDEPVILRCGETVEHRDGCHLTEEQWKRRRKRRRGRNGSDRRTLHMYPARPKGFMQADEIWFPLTPNKMLVLGPQRSTAEPVVRLSGAEAVSFAEMVNEEVIDSAYQWVIAHPDNKRFREIELHPPGPLLLVCDGGSEASEALKSAPSPRMSQRFRKDW